VYSPWLISKNYLKNRFTIDLLATVPFDVIVSIFLTAGVDMLELFSLLKLARVLRLGRIITYLNLKDDIKMSLKLAKLFFFLIIYLHCFGCVWFFFVKQDKKWIPPLDYVWVETNIWEQTIFVQYL
jgi:hypothetical protein